MDAVYVAKIYDGDVENLNFTVMNVGRRDASGKSLLFFKLYADNMLLVEESSSPWECGLGLRVSHGMRVVNLEGPDEYLMRAELYWRNETTAILEDVREFEILVVKLYAAGWSQSISTVQLGVRVPSTLIVSFQNGGNDKMLSTCVSLFDSSGLHVDPQTRSIGDVSAGEVARAEFSVSAPSTAAMGPHVLTFKVSYLDFKGANHTETVSATLTVTKLGASLEVHVSGKVKYSYPIEIVARLLDANGDPIRDEAIRFYILVGPEQEEIGKNVTDSSGYARLAYHGVLGVGDYQLKAFYEGSASHDSTTILTGITVIPIPTKLSPNVPSSTIVGQSANVTVQLASELGKPISGQLLDFYADNEKFASAPTNENGLASVLYVPGRRGSVQLRITYEGGRNFAGVEWSGTLPIEAIQTILTLYANGFALQGDNLVAKATIKDSAGNPIQSAILNFTVVAGNKRNDQILMTDSKGSASLLFKAATTDTIKVDVFYLGDLRYAGSHASVSVTVLNPILLSALVSAVIGGAIAGILGLMKFKLKLDPLAWIRNGFGRPRTRTKPVAAPMAMPTVEHCANCGAAMYDTETTCQACGSRRERIPAQSDLDERVYSYIVEHSGVISLRQAASDLGITPEKVKESAERLRRSGRLG